MDKSRSYLNADLTIEHGILHHDGFHLTVDFCVFSILLHNFGKHNIKTMFTFIHYQIVID